jgi:hypothetical protein
MLNEQNKAKTRIAAADMKFTKQEEKYTWRHHERDEDISEKDRTRTEQEFEI